MNDENVILVNWTGRLVRLKTEKGYLAVPAEGNVLRVKRSPIQWSGVVKVDEERIHVYRVPHDGVEGLEDLIEMIRRKEKMGQRVIVIVPSDAFHILNSRYLNSHQELHDRVARLLGGATKGGLDEAIALWIL